MENKKSKDEFLEKNQKIDKEKRFSFSRKILQIYLPVGFMGLLVAIIIWYSANTFSQIPKQYYPLFHATMETKIKTTIAHLLLEEIISGDKNVNIDEVWAYIDQAEWNILAMLNGGQNDKGTYIPLDDPEHHKSLLKSLEKIRAFRNIAKERYANPDRSIAGSDIDQYFDKVFYSFLNQADDMEATLQQAKTRDLQRVKSVQIALIVLSFLLTGIIIVILSRYERKQASYLSTLKAANQQLTSSEQQLKASNQQLRASEQQLKATNQQLTSSEQQLKA
ncbi:MAG: hypothetical protein U9N54_12265, partial [candidate division Zixibacteria bacterium]|nr:hypothetical protein [candidate division Zixibacteria bacterium]